jgi:hypothetical protein
MIIIIKAPRNESWSPIKRIKSGKRTLPLTPLQTLVPLRVRLQPQPRLNPKPRRPATILRTRVLASTAITVIFLI